MIITAKPGKPSHISDDYRPISLSSFLLKTLERVLDVHIRASIDPALLSTSQHAYTRDKSVETALHSRVEKSMSVKEYTVVIFWILQVNSITSTRMP